MRGGGGGGVRCVFTAKQGRISASNGICFGEDATFLFISVLFLRKGEVLEEEEDVVQCFHPSLGAFFTSVSACITLVHALY